MRQDENVVDSLDYGLANTGFSSIFILNRHEVGRMYYMNIEDYIFSTFYNASDNVDVSAQEGEGPSQ